MISFAVSILAGFVPSVFKISQVEGHPGDLVSTDGRVGGTLQCRANPELTNPAGLIMTIHTIIIGAPNNKVDAPVGAFKVTKLDLDPVGPRTHLSMTGSLIFANQLFNRCLPQNEPIVIIVSGDINSDCLKKTSTGTYKIEVQPEIDRPGVNVEYVGTFDNGDINCQRNPTPIGSGACETGTNKIDNLVGTLANDCITGGGGNDRLSGGDSNDKLNGGDGKDLLIGGDGDDELTGGKGADIFLCGAGNDKITDFKASEGDKKTNDCEHF